MGVLSIKPLILLLVKQPILPNVKSTKIPRDKVIEEVNVLSVLDVEHDGWLAGWKVSIKADAISWKLEKDGTFYLIDNKSVW